MRFPWDRMETDLKRELAYHLHELTAEFERRGHPREEAMRMAKREFGGSEQVKEKCRDERRWAWMSGIRQDVAFALRQIGAFGLLLSIAGTFGLASYTVSMRLRELSIRVALGAQAKQILAAALGRMLMLLASGSVVGIVLGVAASRILSAIVYHASAQDPFVLVSAAFTMALTGALSVAGPVRRALHIDPAKLLREQ